MAQDLQEKQALIDAERRSLSLKAWPLQKCPLDKFPAPVPGLLILPTTYRMEGGIKSYNTLSFQKGQDLRKLVYNHYDERINPSTAIPPNGRNYVNEDGVLTKRHEYLGPMPCVAGFRFTKRNRSSQFGRNAKAGTMIAEIEFWDSMLHVPWIADSLWNVEAAWDNKKNGWFIVDRSTW